MNVAVEGVSLENLVIDDQCHILKEICDVILLVNLSGGQFGEPFDHKLRAADRRTVTARDGHHVDFIPALALDHIDLTSLHVRWNDQVILTE